MQQAAYVSALLPAGRRVHAPDLQTALREISEIRDVARCLSGVTDRRMVSELVKRPGCPVQGEIGGARAPDLPEHPMRRAMALLSAGVPTRKTQSTPFWTRSMERSVAPSHHCHGRSRNSNMTWACNYSGAPRAVRDGPGLAKALLDDARRVSSSD